ncbi:hypothetical protein PHLCEN_2v722 [Hermanssonia centrifuga]|uniref:Enoyl reductase (ER) domain-containing protein n=1 Tax=Hermanssonia centrifuga TaxID=98765 RepID=A0A2R6S559_9APHY|nr:hypothetical protein PHLCEN_2v722 [Hermanssonia centrifuga]
MSTQSVPQIQKAWLILRKGKPSDVLALKQDVAVPSKLSKGEVLVRVQAAAMNPVGYKVMGFLPNFIARRPHVAEHDFTGIIANANGTELENGQAVYGFVPVQLKLKTKQGSLAQYLRVPASHCVPRPSTLTPTQAAGLTLSGLTAYQALFNIAKLEPGQSLFINGGSTAVGIYATQLAKAIGCTVTVSASGKKEDFVRSFGVDNFVDYTKGPVHEQLARNPPSPKFHVIFEAVGGTDVALYTSSEAYLAPGGIFVSVGIHPHGGMSGYKQALHYLWELNRPSLFGGIQRKWKLILVAFDRESFERYSEFVADGKVKPAVDSVYAFEDVQEAYARIMSSRASGKVVVKVDPTVE